MEQFLSKKQVKVILDNAPKGSDQSRIVDALVAKGYKLEGLNDQPVEQAPQSGATFPATGKEGVGESVIKAVGNTPKSAFKLVKNVTETVTHPKRTVTAIKDIVAGGGAKLAELGFENTDIGQNLLAKISESRVANGQQPLQQVDGKFQVEDTPELEKFKQLGSYVKERYGSVENLKKTAIEDPAGTLADLASVLSGAGAAISTAGKVSKIAEVAKVGDTVTKVAQATEPLNAISKTLSKSSKVIKDTTAGKVIGDISPTKSGIRDGAVIKALDLTQGDVANIKKLTGNDIPQYIVDKGILKGTPEEIASELNTTRANTMNEVRSEIGKVQTVYNSADIPKVRQGLSVILEGIGDVPGLEEAAAEVRALASKDTFLLSDVQRAKELIDDHTNIYSKIGDVKNASKAKGLDNIRRDLKTFIEDEVTTATNGETNIRALNNDVQTSYAIEEAINNRATRNLTRQGLSVFDGILGVSGAGAFGIGAGLGLVVLKKIAESPAFRLKLAQVLSATPIKKIKAMANELKSKNLSPETTKLINVLVEETKNNLAPIESTSAVIDDQTTPKQ